MRVMPGIVLELYGTLLVVIAAPSPGPLAGSGGRWRTPRPIMLAAATPIWSFRGPVPWFLRLHDLVCSSEIAHATAAFDALVALRLKTDEIATAWP